MASTRKNERSWAIEMISQINQFVSSNDLIIKRANGEVTISERRGQSMFPDVVLYGDQDLSSILQGWEIKMPDVPITDDDFVHDAQRKATALNLNSCVIWNFTYAKLYIYDETTHEYIERKKWDNYFIKTRDDVQRYKTSWEKTLENVLITVNDYLYSGEVKKKFFGEVLTKTTISNLVNENKYSVSSFLRDAANKDAIMEAHLDTWWKNIRTEYEGDEDNKYTAYAKNIIINWANRIIFAHLIKSRQMSAYAINDLDYDSKPQDGNDTFNAITNKSDFYNIFGSIPYNDCLPPKTWYSLIELSLFLKNSPIKDINQNILQQVLEGSINISKRLVNGQYPTPPILASILSQITIHDVTGNCFDGCCGTGTIPSFIIKYKNRRRIGVEKAMATTWASDKFTLPLQIANLSMTSYDTINIPCRLFQKDILTLTPGDVVEIVNPQTGKKEKYELPLFDAIISNLPFVKAKDIPSDDSAYIATIQNENNLSGRSDYSYYIALHLKELVKTGGHIGIILSNSFLGTEAGNLFMDAIKESFDDIKIHISGCGRWFTNADIVTALLVMRKKNETNNNSNISFFTWKKSLDNLILNNDLQKTIINSSILDKELDDTIITRTNYSFEELNSLKELNVSYNSLFSDLKWLLEINNCIVPISNYLDVFRGSRRGWDALFYPSSKTKIEPQFLRDVLINAKKTDSYVATPTKDKKAFCCSMDMNKLKAENYTGAIEWIQRFQSEKNEKGIPLPKVLAKKDHEWYELTTDEEAEIFTMMNPDDRMFYAKFEKPTFVNQRLIGLKRKNSTDNLDLLHALLNSILSLFYIEAVGFGRGLGVLDINKESISKCYMLNPNLLSDEQIKNILKKFTLLKKRGIVDMDSDLSDPIRTDFDFAILEAYNISQYHSTIIDSLKRMRKIRKAAKEKTGIPGLDAEALLYAIRDLQQKSFAAE